jgi:hypothetical protein
VNILLADTARDELYVLRAKIEDDNGGGVHRLVWQGLFSL